MLFFNEHTSFFFNIYSKKIQKKNNSEKINTIVIGFLPMLGIGDLIMLSPTFSKIANLFPHSKVYIITNIPNFIAFEENITIITPSNIKNIKNIDLFISPSHITRHIQYIFKAKYWIGYFFQPILQANFRIPKNIRYSDETQHYIQRMINILSVLQPNNLSLLKETILKKSFVYPELKSTKIDLNLSENYLCLGLFSRDIHRNWDIDKYGQIIKKCLEEELFNQIIILGGVKDNDLATQLINYTGDRKNIINLTGETSITEATYLISKSTLYLGVDTGLSHIAFLKAPNTIVIYTTVLPNLRSPLTKQKGISKTFSPPSLIKSIHNDQKKLNTKTVNAHKASLDIDEVYKAIVEILE